MTGSHEVIGSSPTSDDIFVGIPTTILCEHQVAVRCVASVVPAHDEQMYF